MTELHFASVEDPYLLVAALRRRLGDEALEAAVLIPSADGPAVELRDDLLGDSEVARWLTILHAERVDRVT